MRSSLLGAAAVLLGGLLAVSCSDLDLGDDAVISRAVAAARPADPTPDVVITAPDRASFLAPGPVSVEGRVAPVDSATPIQTVTLGGTVIPVGADGRFAASVDLAQGLNVIRAAATDSLGRTGQAELGVLAGQWRPLTERVPEAAGLKVNDAALDAVAAILEPIAAAYDLNALTQGPIYDGSLLGGAATARVTLAGPQLTLAPPARAFAATDGLHLEVDATDLEVTVTAVGSLLGATLGPETAKVEADAATVTAVVELIAQPSGHLGVRVVQSTVSFTNFRVSGGSTLISLVLPLLQGWIESRVESLLAGKIQDLGVAFDDTLRDLLDPPAPRTVFGHPFSYSALPTSLSHEAGSLGLVLDFDAPPVQLTARGAAAPGSFSTPALVPLTPLTSARGLALVVDDDAINRLLHAAWAAGSLDDALDPVLAGLSVGGGPLTVGDLARFLPELLLALPPDAPLTLEVEVGLPPVFEVTGAPDLARLSLGEVLLTVFVDQGNGPTLLAKVVANLRAGVTVALEPGGLRLESTQFAEIGVDILEEPLVDLDETRARTLLGTAVPLIVPQLVAKVGVAPIPTQLSPATFRNLTATDDGSGRLRIELDMVR